MICEDGNRYNLREDLGIVANCRVSFTTQINAKIVRATRLAIYLRIRRNYIDFDPDFQTLHSTLEED